MSFILGTRFKMFRLNRYDFPLKEIKALTVLVGRLSLSVGWENGPEPGFKTVSFL